LVKKDQDYPLKCGFLRAWIYEVGSDDTGNVKEVFRKHLFRILLFRNASSEA
jgi:hypothetical protein